MRAETSAPTVFTETPCSTLSFGDVCNEFPWFDAALRSDASALAVQEAPKRFAERYGVDRLDFFYPVDGETQSIPKSTDYVLAHGQAFEEAVCVSDDCVIESALGREGAKPRGQRLGDAGREVFNSNLRRHLIGEDRVAELHRSFRVRAVDVAESLDAMTRLSLHDDPRSELAMRWAAHVCRMGPMVATDNANKLAQLLIEKEGWSEEQAADTAQALVNVSAAGWLVESKGLENAGEHRDEHRDDLAAVDLAAAVGPLRQSLELLRAQADAALSALP
jgi:hypothetical protein